MKIAKTRHLRNYHHDIVVAICTYNNANLLDKTLKALEQQKVDNSILWSVLVVDNNCTDNTAEVVERYKVAQTIPGLKIVQENCQGLAYARRCALRETDSEFIAFVDDDCLLSPHWVQQAMTFFQQHPHAGAVGSRVQLLWEVPPAPEILQFQGYLSSYDLGDLPLVMPSFGNTYLVGAGLVVRRSALLACGWLEKMILVGRNGKVLTAGDDSEMVLRIRNAGYELWYNPAMQLQHFIPERRISVDYLCGLLRGIGKSRPLLYTLGNCQQPTLAVRLNLLGDSIAYFSRVLLTITYRNILQNNALQPERKIYLCDSLGYCEGALQFLFRGYQV